MPPFLPYQPSPAEPADLVVVMVTCLVLVAILGLVLALGLWHNHHGPGHHHTGHPL